MTDITCAWLAGTSEHLGLNSSPETGRAGTGTQHQLVSLPRISQDFRGTPPHPDFTLQVQLLAMSQLPADPFCSLLSSKGRCNFRPVSPAWPHYLPALHKIAGESGQARPREKQASKSKTLKMRSWLPPLRISQICRLKVDVIFIHVTQMNKHRRIV